MVTPASDLYRGNKASFGPKVDYHCPHDEATLREWRETEGYFACPCCWTLFDKAETINANAIRKGDNA